jgi:hypothetical protein
VAITQNLVADNEILAPSAGYGAGIWGNTFGYGMETIEIRDNVVGPDNLAPLNGGGVAAWVTPIVSANHTMIVDGNTVSGNLAGLGGGMDLLVDVDYLGLAGPGQRFSMTVSDNAITGNHALFDGGGVFVEYNSKRSATAADATSNIAPADEMSLLIRRNTVTGNVADLGGGGAIVYVTGDADPEGVPPNPCLPGNQAAAVARVRFQDNLIADNTANNVDPLASGDIIGAGILALPTAFGEALAAVEVTGSTIAGNTVTNDGFVGGLEIAGFTDFDCDLSHAGAISVQVDRTIVAQNDLQGIGGPPPDPGQTVTVTRSSSFGNGGGDYEGTLFPGGTPANNFSSAVDPLLDPLTRVPDSCSPMFNVGQCVTPAGQTCFSSSSLASAPPPPACGAGGCTFLGAGHIENPDVNEDNVLDGIDLVRLAAAFGALANESPTPPDARYDVETDFDRSGLVDGDDLDLLSPDFGRVCQP